MENNENKEICSECGGKCCERSPGVCFPSDFKDENDIVDKILGGSYCIDWWEGNLGDGCEDIAYFVRPRTKNYKDRVFDGGWGGECVLLTETGCSLKFDDRPSECRHLKPNVGGCAGNELFSKESSCRAWRKHQDMFENLKECA